MAERERSIVCAAGEVRLLLAGETVELRRMMEPQAPSVDNVRAMSGSGYDIFAEWKCPFGMPGERRWVKEAFLWPEQDDSRDLCIYKADCADPRAALKDLAKYRDGSTRWTLAAKMPRWASRLAVIVDAVRCERRSSGAWEWVLVAKRAEARNG